MVLALMKNLDSLVDAATAVKQAKASKSAAGAFNMDWSAGADEVLQQVQDNTLRKNTKMRAEKRALTEKSTRVEVEHILPFVVNPKIKNKIKKDPDKETQPEVSKCPFSSMGKRVASEEEIDLPWHKDAQQRLNKIPQGSSRDMTKKATNAIAQQQNINHISLEFLENILSIFNSGSKNMKKSLPWQENAETAIAKAPAMVQGMLASEIEAYAKRESLTEVDLKTVQLVKKKWTDEGRFHLDPDDPRNKN